MQANSHPQPQACWPEFEAEPAIKEWWAYAFDINSETWEGGFKDRNEAMLEAFAYDPDREVVYTGKGVERDPASFLDAKEIFSALDDDMENCPFDESWQEFWKATDPDMDELTEMLRTAFGAWVAIHKLSKAYIIDRASKMGHYRSELD